MAVRKYPLLKDLWHPLQFSSVGSGSPGMTRDGAEGEAAGEEEGAPGFVPHSGQNLAEAGRFTPQLEHFEDAAWAGAGA